MQLQRGHPISSKQLGIKHNTHVVPLLIMCTVVSIVCTSSKNLPRIHLIVGRWSDVLDEALRPGALGLRHVLDQNTRCS